MGWTIGIDVGGTFTDLFAFEVLTGEIRLTKVSSTPNNPANAVITGLKTLLSKAEINIRSLNRISHGTTVGTNALIQRKGGTVAMLTTKGFRDLLEIGRQTRPHMFSLIIDHPPSLVPRHLRFEVDERSNSKGIGITPPDLNSVRNLVPKLTEENVESCAIGFLFAHLNGSHEEQVAEILKDEGFTQPLSLSSQVQPEFREYERFSTTVLNAYLQPVVEEYLSTLEKEIIALAPTASLGINQSNGGLMSADQARAFPVRTALSGPAAGAMGAVHVSKEVNHPNVITLDMGGTSADVALIRDYDANISFDKEVAGFPIRLPAIDIETVGAGGGSIAWFDRDGLLKVGPQSAGATPGPSCYALGGQQPTVTDANLILGRLSPKGLLDGTMPLQLELAETAFLPLAKKLGFTVKKTAHGVLGIVIANMVRAIRTISVERGHDPRQFALMAFGGAGPLHSREVAANLGITEVIIPLAPGIVCAQGLIVSDLKEDFVITHRVSLETAKIGIILERCSQLLSTAENWFVNENIPKNKQFMTLSIDARYVGQNFELAVRLANGKFTLAQDLPNIEFIKRAFFSAHEQAYGYAPTADEIEIINFRLTARGRLHDMQDTNKKQVISSPPTTENFREVCFDGHYDIWTPVYERSQLCFGQEIIGPAIINQLDTTTVVFPGDSAAIATGGNILLSLGNNQ